MVRIPLKRNLNRGGKIFFWLRKRLPKSKTLTTNIFNNRNTDYLTHNVFYEQFRFLFFLLTVFGRLAIYQRSKGKYEWRWFSLLSLYGLFSYTLQTYLAVLVFDGRLKYLVKYSDYDEIIFSLTVLSYTQVHFHVPISYWIQGSRIAQYITLWSDFQRNWYLVTKRRLKLQYRKSTFVFGVSILTTLALVIVYENYSALHEPYPNLLLYFVSIGSTLCTVLIWCVTCFEIEPLAEHQLLTLRKSLQRHPDPAFYQNWRNLWIELNSLVEYQCFSNFLAVTPIFITYSLTFLLGAYCTISTFTIGEFNMKIISYGVASSASLLIVYAICESGHQAKTKVQDLKSQFIIKFRSSLPQNEIKLEVDQTFEMLLHQNCPDLHLANFVKLNRPLFISFLANMVTYLIVILQFKQ